jgi:LAO/AO transport system kinase
MSRGSATPEELLAAATAGDRASLARVLSLVERGGEGARAVARALTGPATVAGAGAGAGAGRGPGGKAYTVGITGSPGAGKSTLTSALIDVARSHDQRVAVLAVDPSSPFTGGAILGDRVRMGDHALDDAVFIRSMATRGHLGGLAVAAPEAVRVLGSAGYDWVLVETVGVGQVEVEVAGQTDTTVVVVNPGWGDAVQAAKAGLMEIADVFVVNKADRPGAAEAEADLRRVLDLSGTGGGAPGDWRPPIERTTATSGEGVADVWDAVRRHRDHLTSTGELDGRRRRRAGDEIRRLVGVRLLERARAVTGGDRAAELAEAVVRGDTDPWTAADELLAAVRSAP